MHVIFTKSNCRYCGVAKSWLEAQKIPFQEQSLDDEETRSLFKAAYPDIRSVPVIFDPEGKMTMAWKSASPV